MLARLYALAAVAALCASGVGCRAVHCGDGCDRGCSLAFQKYDCSRDGGCGGGSCGNSTSCTTQCGDGCQAGGCDGACCGQGRGLKGWLSRNVCQCTGCGDVYWSEWYNDPPCVYEPCDRCGNFTGSGCDCAAYRAPYRLDSEYAKAPAPRAALKLAEGEAAEGELLR